MTIDMNVLPIITTSVAALLVPVSIYVLARNEWVYRHRIRLIHEDYKAFERLPSYQTMLYRRWWIWDIRKFLP